MQTKNLSRTSPEIIIIKQSPYINCLNAPFLFQRASQPLTLNESEIEQYSALNASRKDMQNQIQQFKINGKRQQLDLSPSICYSLGQDKKNTINESKKIQEFIQENQNLKKQASELKAILQEQRKKYNQLKNLYKEGEVIFSMLQDRKINLQKQCKQLREQLDSAKISRVDQKSSLSRTTNIKTIKVNKSQIPVIKVTVPPQIFWHSNIQKIQNVPLLKQIKNQQKDKIINAHTTNQLYNLKNYQLLLNQNIQNQFQRQNMNQINFSIKHQSNMNQANVQIRQQNNDLKLKCVCLQDKLSQLTSYSEKLMFDCQSAIQRLLYQANIQQQQIKNQQQQINSQQKQIDSQQQQIKSQQQQIESLQSQINKLYQILQNKNTQLEQIYCLSRNRAGSSLAASNNSHTSNKQTIQTKKIVHGFNSKQKNTRFTYI